jgi:hypothetical protein
MRLYAAFLFPSPPSDGGEGKYEKKELIRVSLIISPIPL